MGKFLFVFTGNNSTIFPLSLAQRSVIALHPILERTGFLDLELIQNIITFR